MTRLAIVTGVALMLGAGLARADAAPPVVEHLAEAIRLQTVSHQDRALIDYAAFERFRGFAEATYPRVFSQLEVEPVSAHSLLVTWRGRDPAREPVLFDAHYDVVPVEAGTESDWRHPPFAGVVEGGFVWGRGALDDKGSVIALLEALESLLAAGFVPERTLLFVFGHDEEIRGVDGAAQVAALLEARGVSVEYVIGEGGALLVSSPMLPERTVAMIAVAEKSYLTLQLIAEGEGGHSSRPPADSAITRLSKAVAALHDQPFEAKWVSPVSDMFEAVGEHTGGVRGLMLRNQWLSEPFLLSQLAGDPIANAMVRTTTAVTILRAGVKENVIAQRAEATVNFRLLPGDTPDQVIERVERIIDDPRIEIRSDYWGAGPGVADVDGAGYAHIRAAVETVVPDAVVVPGLLVATTDSRHYAGLTADVYRFRPLTLDLSGPVGAHGTNERVSVSSLEQAVDLYRDLVARVSGP